MHMPARAHTHTHTHTHTHIYIACGDLLPPYTKKERARERDTRAEGLEVQAMAEKHWVIRKEHTYAHMHTHTSSSVCVS